MAPQLCCLALCAAAAALPALWLARGSLSQLRPLVLEPPGLASALRALPKRRVSEAEREQFQREGVLLLRGLVRDEQLLTVLKEALLEHACFHAPDYTESHRFNGAVRALLREGPLFPAMAQLLQAPELQMDECPIWGGQGQEMMISAWHQDAPLSENFVTLWLPLTAAPHALEFFRGSHRAAAGMMQACNQSWQLGKVGERLADHNCAMEFGKEHLDPELGKPSHVWEDLAAGDVWLFDGRMMHRGVLWAKERVALSIRAKPSFHPGPCCQCLYPWTDTTLACQPEDLLPRPRSLWPELNTALPSGDTTSDRARRRAAAAITQAAFGRSGSLRAALGWLQRMLGEA